MHPYHGYMTYYSMEKSLVHLLFLCYSQLNFYIKFLTSGVSLFFQSTINYTKEDSAYETQTSIFYEPYRSY